MANQSHEGAQEPAGPPPTPRWKGRQSLEIVFRFNQRCFQLIGEAVAGDSRCTVAAVAENRELWSSLDDAARTRAARFPFLVLDVRFRDEEWWRSAIDRKAPVTQGLCSPALAEQLMEETLLFAAQTVNWDAAVARLTLGMSSRVAEWLTELHPQHLADIWRQHSGELRLRWQEQPQFWRALLIAARDADGKALAECRMEAQLLFCADMFGARKQ